MWRLDLLPIIQFDRDAIWAFNKDLEQIHTGCVPFTIRVAATVQTRIQYIGILNPEYDMVESTRAV